MLALAPFAEAQCLTPDGLTGPCCLPAAPSLPTSMPPVFLPGLGVCRDARINEEPVLQGDMIPLVQACLCPLSFQPPQQTGVHTSINGACGGSTMSLNAFPVAPWHHLVETSICAWTTGASNPGPEQAWVAEGLSVYGETCSLPAPAASFDIFYGAVTDGGYPVTSSTTPRQTFLDLASNHSLPLTSPITFPLFGAVAATDHLINVDL